MAIYINKDVIGAPVSAIRVAQQEGLHLKEQGIDFINGAQGSPTYPLPKPIMEAGVKAAQDKNVLYRPAPGTPAQRQAAAEYVNLHWSETAGKNTNIVTADHCIITNAGSHALHMADKMIGEMGDAILVPQCYFPNYQGAIMSNGKRFLPYNVTREHNFIPRYEDFAQAIENYREQGIHTAGLIINFPSNPTGATLDEKSAQQLAADLTRLCESTATHIGNQRFMPAIIEDAAYIDLQQTPLLVGALLPEDIREQWVACYTASKSFSLARERAGIMVSFNPDILREAPKLMTVETTGSSWSAGEQQRAGHELALLDFGAMADVNAYYQKRIRLYAEGLNAITTAVQSPHPAANFIPSGGMFLYADFSWMKGGKVPTALREAVGADTINFDIDIFRLLKSMHLMGSTAFLAVPGSMCGDVPHNCNLRIAGIETPERIEEGLRTIRAATALLFPEKKAALEATNLEEARAKGSAKSR